MKKISLLGALLFLLMLLFSASAKASDWTTYKSNHQDNPVIFDPGQYPSASDFSLPNTDVSTPYGYPVTTNGALFYSKNFGSPQIAELYAVKISDGSLIWRKNYSKPIYNLSIYNGKLYFGADKIYCLNLVDGGEAWVQSAGLVQNPINTPRVYMVYQGVVLAQELYSNNSNKAFLALNAENGQILTNMNRYDMTYATGVIANGSTFYISYRSGSSGSVNAFNIDTFTRIWSGGLCLNGDQPTIDPENNRIYLLGTTRICVIDSTNGKKLFNENKHFDYGLVKYGNGLYGFYGGLLGYFAQTDNRAKTDYISTLVSPNKFVSPPIIVNDTIYGGSNKGAIWSRNLESGKEKITTVADLDEFVHHLIYAEGKIIAITKNDRVGSSLRVFDINNLSVSTQNEWTISLTSPYKTDGAYTPYLGQLHTHYLPESPVQWLKTYNVLPTAYDVEKRYLDAGYDFVALTEHNDLAPDPGVEGILHLSNAEEITPTGKGGHILAIGISDLVDFSLPDQERINLVASQGGLPILAHPNINNYAWSTDSLMKLDNFSHIEIFQGAGRYYFPTSLYFGDYHALDKLDILASNHKIVYGTAGDDYTPGDSGFDQAGVVVFSKTKTQTDIMKNLKEGNFYALQGSSAPRIEISITGNTITITSDKEAEIKFIGNGGKTLQTTSNIFLSSYTANGDEVFVRAEVTSHSGIDYRTSWTQPIFVNKVISKTTSESGEHYLDIGQAKLKSNATAPVTANILSTENYPKSSPPFGYLSPIYSLNSDGDVEEGTELSINYKGKNIQTNENNLAIYTYNETSAIWEKVGGLVDKVHKTVTASLPHFSLYALSAEQPEDVQKPIVALTSPEDVVGLLGQINFIANATDNNAVIEIRFIVDDKLVAFGSDNFGGFSAILDMNNYSLGDHILKIEAEDFVGNIGIYLELRNINYKHF